MFVIKQMRLNKFEPRPIISNRELFVAKGDNSAKVESKATSDCYNEPSILGASKTKILGLGADVVKKAVEHHEKGGTTPLNKSTENL